MSGRDVAGTLVWLPPVRVRRFRWSRLRFAWAIETRVVWWAHDGRCAGSHLQRREWATEP